MRSVIGMMVNRQKFLPEAILASFCCHTIHFCDELAMLYELNKKALPESFTSQLQHEKQKLIGVFVIGESANRNHWGLYGYPRATTPELEKLQNEIRETVKVHTSFLHTNFLEILRDGINKGSALKWLCDKKGIKRENVIAFGDNYNDIEMIEFAGVGVAMENGEEELKKSADYIALNNNDDGVGKFLKDFLDL